MSDYKDVLPVGVFLQEPLKVGIGRSEIERRAHLNLAFIPEFVANKLRRLEGALQGTGDDDIRLDFESAQESPHDHALFFAFGDQAAFGVELRALARNSSVRVPHEVEVHGWGVGVSGGAKPLPLKVDLNTAVTKARIGGLAGMTA